jgi:hypothetical protein
VTGPARAGAAKARRIRESDADVRAKIGLLRVVARETFVAVPVINLDPDQNNIKDLQL